MAIELTIHDGNPWWLSNDVWTVPGNNPEGAPGVPIVGQNCFLWARVTNAGNSSVTNATVNFYWANPAVGFDRNTANFIGTSNVNLSASESAEILCLTPWVPEFVNNGHECILAEAFHDSLDPLPAVPDFNVPTDRHVAQRNLHVVNAVNNFFSFPLVIFNTIRNEQEYQLKVYQGSLEEIELFQKPYRMNFSSKKKRVSVNTGFTQKRCPTEKDLENCDDKNAKISIRGNGQGFTNLIGKIDGDMALIHIEQYRNDIVVGGLSILVKA